MKSLLAVMAISMIAAGQTLAQTAPSGAPVGRFDLIIDHQKIIEQGAAESDTRAGQDERRAKQKLRQSKKWTEMERIEQQGVERLDLSQKAPGKLQLEPVLGNRRQAGNPVKHNEDLDKKSVGIDFTLDF